MPKKLFLIDGYAHIYQAFYAIRGLTGPDGEPVNAVFGFARMLKRIIEDYQPDYLAVAFDLPGKVFRHDMYPEYKATRKPMPVDLQRQIPLIREMLQRAGTPVLSAEGSEADDVLGTVARRAAKDGVACVLVTTDKDAEQLIDETTSVLHLRKDKATLLDPAGLKEAKGLEPWQVVELMALSGDSSDNIPGAPGVGPKTATDLIGQFGSVEKLYKNLDEVKSRKLRERLAEHRDQVELSRRLVEIDCTVPLELDLEACRTDRRDVAGLGEFYRALGFRSLMEKESRSAPGEAPPKARRQATLFKTADDGAPQTDSGEGADAAAVVTLADVQTDYRTVRSPAEVRGLAGELPEHAPFAIDLETTSLDPHEARLVGISLSWREHQGIYIACAGPEGEEVCPAEETLELLRPVLEDGAVGKIGQNLKYDTQVLKRYGAALAGIVCDTMLASYLLQPGERGHGLDALALRHLNYRTIKITELIGEGREQISMDQVAMDQAAPYACEDADITFRLHGKLWPLLEAQQLLPLLRDVEVPLLSVLAQMEWDGICIDSPKLAEISEEFQTELDALKARIWQDAGTEFNVNSPKQLSEVLFDRLKLPRPRGKVRTTGYATDSAVLGELAPSHSIARHLLRWRELSKLKGTYADALIELVNPHTGRLHTSFNQTGTATGRLSSSKPNLQNIPVRTPLGRRIRSAFVPGAADMSLVSADYSQVELRMLAHCSGDETLREAFRRNRDIHRFVAAQIAGTSEDEVTTEMRQRAKAVNFGIVYGQSAYGLAQQIDMSFEEAQAFIDGYFARYPRVKEFIGRTIEEARNNGYVHTLAGRRRAITGIRSSGPVRSAAERVAVNTVIQGSAADLVKMAMAAISRGLPLVSARSRMLLQIHDELLFEVPDDEVREMGEFVREKMSGAMQLTVPLKVDVAVGKNWEEAK